MNPVLDLLRRYYDGCSTGDVDAMTATMDDDVVHYFLAPNPGSTPVRGAEHLARYWRKVAARIEGVWVIDHFLGTGDEAVIEWTLFWTPEPGATRIATRGAEWFVLRQDRIAEIRSYYQQHAASTGLAAFPYEQRGYSALETEAVGSHPAVQTEGAR